MVGILTGFHFDLTQVGITNNSGEDEPMELDHNEEEKMQEFVEEIDKDMKSPEEGEELLKGIQHDGLFI